MAININVTVLVSCFKQCCDYHYKYILYISDACLLLNVRLIRYFDFVLFGTGGGDECWLTVPLFIRNRGYG